jgi:hypothetical protein
MVVILVHDVLVRWTCLKICSVSSLKERSALHKIYGAKRLRIMKARSVHYAGPTVIFLLEGTECRRKHFRVPFSLWPV